MNQLTANDLPIDAPSRTLAHVRWFIFWVLIARIAYLTISPWKLVADEAQYWVWAQHLDWSYYTKGPGVAWVIWASTKLFGDHEWSVRLPSAIAGAILAWAGARLAFDVTVDRTKASLAAWYTAIVLTITPGFFTTAQLLTPDMFYATAWLVAALCAFRAARGSLLAWAGVGAAIGVGCLFKYTALLFVPGLIVWLIVNRRQLVGRRVAIGLVLALVAFLICASPIAIWNVQRGWPTVAHQLGRIHMPGGDEKVQWNWSPMWFVSFVGAQLGILGVVGAILIALSIRPTRSQMDSVGRSLLIWLALPILAGYVLLSVFKQVQGNWAIAGYTTPLVLAGIALAHAPRLRHERLRVTWAWFVGVGICVAAFIMFGPWLFKLPGVRDIYRVQRLDHHIGGTAPQMAAAVQAQRDALGGEPLLICKGYQNASLLSFYLPDRPQTFVAGPLMGGRPTPWDFFDGTDLHDPALLGHDALLVGGRREDRDVWARTLKFASIEFVSGTGAEGIPAVFRAKGYAGVRATATTAPTAVDSDDDD